MVFISSIELVDRLAAPLWEGVLLPLLRLWRSSLSSGCWGLRVVPPPTERSGKIVQAVMYRFLHAHITPRAAVSTDHGPLVRNRVKSSSEADKLSQNHALRLRIENARFAREDPRCLRRLPIVDSLRCGGKNARIDESQAEGETSWKSVDEVFSRKPRVR
jgi:hypothetical protein